jgi:hypothetical protein
MLLLAIHVAQGHPAALEGTSFQKPVKIVIAGSKNFIAYVTEQVTTSQSFPPRYGIWMATYYAVTCYTWESRPSSSIGRHLIPKICKNSDCWE